MTTVAEKVQWLEGVKEELKTVLGDLRLECAIEEAVHRNLKEEQREMREQHEELFWRRIETEQEIRRVLANSAANEKHTKEAEEARITTERLTSLLQKTEGRLASAARERETLQQKTCSLRETVTQAHRSFKQSSVEASGLSECQRIGLSALHRKIQSRTDIQSLLLSLARDLETLRHNIEIESKQRETLTTQLNYQANIIRCGLEVALNDRETIVEDLHNGLKQRAITRDNLQLLSAQTQIALRNNDSSKISLSVDDCLQLQEIVSSLDLQIEDIYHYDEEGSRPEDTDLLPVGEINTLHDGMVLLESHQAALESRISLASKGPV